MHLNYRKLQEASEENSKPSWINENLTKIKLKGKEHLQVNVMGKQNRADSKCGNAL